MWLHTWHPPSVLVTTSGLTIYWYGVFLAGGALAGYLLIRYLARDQRSLLKHLESLIVWLIIGGLLGGRLYHVANEWSYYRLHADQIFQIWQGGLAIHGAVLAGLIIVVIYATIRRLSTWTLLDCLVPGMALGQAIGRWGNYFNQELFGRPTALPWGLPIATANRPTNYPADDYFHPTFLYESLGNLVITGLLIWLWRKFRRSDRTRPGIIALAYFLMYGILRIATESLRIDRTPIILGVRLPIIASGLIILAAITALIIILRRPHARAA